jgi:hypothetical protein
MFGKVISLPASVANVTRFTQCENVSTLKPSAVSIISRRFERTESKTIFRFMLFICRSPILPDELSPPLLVLNSIITQRLHQVADFLRNAMLEDAIAV